MSKTAITPTRAENFSEWYLNTIAASDISENSPVRGCMTIKPYGWAIWELIRNAMDEQIKNKYNVQNVNFPLLIPVEYLSREAKHVEGFAKECAVVTHHRLKSVDGELVPDPESELTEKFVIRPTSETIIGEAMSRWIQSYRDLPMKLNQWVNVMRWEMRPRMFLRNSEFNWQEGHNVFAAAEEALKDAVKMGNFYKDVAENILAIPGLMGRKVPEERFAGANETYTLEMIMQDDKALQACTSHDLGQNFSKSFDIKFLGPDGKLAHAHTTSWGTSTRLMGGVIAVHGDDDGLVLPPAIAPYQVVIIPILTEQNEVAHSVASRLRDVGVRVLVDDSDARSADKMWKWIKCGVPLRVEIGAREAETGSATITRRDLGRESKRSVSVDGLVADVNNIMAQIQSDMLEKARKRNASVIINVSSLDEMEKILKEKDKGFFRLPYSETRESDGITRSARFDEISEKYKVECRCIDDTDPTYVFVAKAY
jgi:prolyl-tRNA synthetase